MTLNGTVNTTLTTVENIERAKQEWEATVDALPQLICVLDHHGKVLRINRTVETWQLGHVFDVPGQHITDVLHPNANPEASYLRSFLQRGWQALEHEMPTSLDVDDDILGRYLRLHLQPIPNHLKKVNASKTHAVLVIEDITNTHALAQHVQQQQQLALVGQLAAGVGHYFNNILTSIIGFAELLRLDSGLTESIRADLQRIVEQGQRAAHITRQLLDFSRRSIMQRYPVNFAVFLNTTVSSILKSTAATDIELKLSIAPHTSYTIQIDPTQMQAALLNLIHNSLDAMPAGGVLSLHLSRLGMIEAALTTVPLTHYDDWIVLTIRDTGTGIDPEHLPHVFEPFFTTKEIGLGTGLGLAQAYGIIKQHDGEIIVESEVGHGTTFTIYLPVHTASSCH